MGGKQEIIIFRYFRKMGAECNWVARRFFVPLQQKRIEPQITQIT